MGTPVSDWHSSSLFASHLTPDRSPLSFLETLGYLYNPGGQSSIRDKSLIESDVFWSMYPIMPKSPPKTKSHEDIQEARKNTDAPFIKQQTKRCWLAVLPSDLICHMKIIARYIIIVVPESVGGIRATGQRAAKCAWANLHLGVCLGYAMQSTGDIAHGFFVNFIRGIHCRISVISCYFWNWHCKATLCTR